MVRGETKSELAPAVLELVSLLNPEHKDYVSESMVLKILDNAIKKINVIQNHIDRIEELVSKVALKKQVAEQNVCFQMYHMEDLIRSISQGPLYDFAKAQFDLFRINSLSKLEDVRINVYPSKSKERAAFEALTLYGSDNSKLVDLNIASISCKNMDDCVKVLQKIITFFSNPNMEVVEIRYNFPIPKEEDESEKYEVPKFRCIRAYIRIRGVLWEVSVAPIEMWEAKQRTTRTTEAIRYVHERSLLLAVRGDIDSMEAILDQPGVYDAFDPSSVCDKNGFTCLHHAAFRGDTKMCKMLTEKYKANVWQLDNNGVPHRYWHHSPLVGWKHPCIWQTVCD